MRTTTEALASYDMEEVPLSGRDGRRVAPLCALAEGAAAVLLALGATHTGRSGWHVVWAASVVLLACGATGLRGLVRVQQGSAVVVQLFGAYVGTIRAPGLRWVSPWSKRRAVSAKVRTHETPSLKVNDSDGNPVEIVVELDEERKAAMVSNLLVVLCSDHPTEPIVNAGSLYH